MKRLRLGNLKLSMTEAKDERRLTYTQPTRGSHSKRKVGVRTGMLSGGDVYDTDSVGP